MSAPDTKEIDAAIRSVFDEGCAAWNRGDLDGYLASYWDSEKTLWISGGSLRRGKAAIVDSYRSRFATPARMGHLTIADLEVDVLTPTDATAFGYWKLMGENGTATGVFTVQLRKREGIWEFVSDHSSTLA
jgi:uncharacterized protein (TIGR02246 family)